MHQPLDNAWKTMHIHGVKGAEMSKLTKLQAKLDNGQFKNFSFSDFEYIMVKTGWVLDRVSGSHQIYIHPKNQKFMNIQNKNGKAKPFQIKQYLELMK